MLIDRLPQKDINIPQLRADILLAEYLDSGMMIVLNRQTIIDGNSIGVILFVLRITGL
jgi:hypothetical protein